MRASVPLGVDDLIKFGDGLQLGDVADHLLVLDGILARHNLDNNYYVDTTIIPASDSRTAAHGQFQLSALSGQKRMVIRQCARWLFFDPPSLFLIFIIRIGAIEILGLSL